MKKLTKIMSVMLSLVLALGIFSLCASASDEEWVDYAEIIIDTDIAGAEVDDYYDYITILSPELQFEDDYGDPAVFVRDINENPVDEFEQGKTYYITVYLSCNDGYVFEEDAYFNALVNGISPDYCSIDYWQPDGYDVDVYYAEIEFYITIGQDFGYRVIDVVDIDIDIQPGDLVGDYYDYVTINTDYLHYDDEFGYKALYAYYDYENDDDSIAADVAYEGGTFYDLHFYFGAEQGYYISSYAEVYINGELYDGYRYTSFDYDSESEYEYSYINIDIDDYLVNEVDDTVSFWDLIADFFMNIFTAISDFFGGIFSIFG